MLCEWLVSFPTFSDLVVKKHPKITLILSPVKQYSVTIQKYVPFKDKSGPCGLFQFSDQVGNALSMPS